MRLIRVKSTDDIPQYTGIYDEGHDTWLLLIPNETDLSHRTDIGLGRDGITDEQAEGIIAAWEVANLKIHKQVTRDALFIVTCLAISPQGLLTTDVFWQVAGNVEIAKQIVLNEFQLKFPATDGSKFTVLAKHVSDLTRQRIEKQIHGT